MQTSLFKPIKYFKALKNVCNIKSGSMSRNLTKCKSLL